MNCLKNCSFAIAGLAASIALTCAAPAVAGPVIFNGATFEVTYSVTGDNSADFLYTADFGTPGWETSSGTNAIDYIIAVEFNLAGYKVLSVDAFDTTASGGALVWETGASGSSNSQGCGAFGPNQSTACAEDMPFDESRDPAQQITQGIVEWTFSVTFDKDFGDDPFSSVDNHIGGFFQRCKDTQNPNDPEGSRACTGGTGLSLPTSFTPIEPDPKPVPAPGPLALILLGLVGLKISRKRPQRS